MADREWEKLARRALVAILAEPHGCAFCDSGTLRGLRPHAEECGFGLAADAVALARPPEPEDPSALQWGIDAHHDDHSQPLCVAWLCRKCHAAVDTHYGRPRRGPYGGRVRDLPRLTIRASQPVLDRYKEMRDQSRLTEHEFFKRMVEHYATEGL